MLDEVDDKANPMGIKGVGELGICGAGAAVANAIYNACGVRVRDYPITPDKILTASCGRTWRRAALAIAHKLPGPDVVGLGQV